MKIVTSDDDISKVVADAIVIPADSELGIDANFFMKAGRAFEQNHEKMKQQQQIKFPLIEPTVQHVEPGAILPCKGTFLVFPGSISGKKPSASDGVNVLETFNLLMDQMTQMDYNSVAIILSSTNSKSDISEILYSVACRAAKIAGFNQLILMSDSKSVLKTTRSLLGGESRDLSSQKETNAFLQSLTAASTSILKSSAKMINKKLSTKSRSASICYFSTPRTELKIASDYVLQCCGETIKMSTVKADVNLYGAENVLDLLILRGSGEEVDWAEPSEKCRINDSSVCKKHLNELLLNWKTHKVFNKQTDKIRKTPVCRLPNALHDSKLKLRTAKRRLTKEEAVRMMNGTGVLCHVGAVMCETHFKNLEENKFYEIKFDHQASSNISEDDASDEYTPSTEEPSVASNEDIQDMPEEKDEIAKKVQEIAHLLGLSRLSSEKKWSELSEAVQEKKINSMIHLFDGICKVTAGEESEDFRKRCLAKMRCVQPDDRVTDIMSTIASSLEHCPNRSVRNQILSLVTGIFSERLIKEYTGCTSYDIRQAKLSARRGFEEIKEIFHRDKGGRALLKEFVAFLALPDVTVCLPSIGRIYQLENGDIVELAKAVRIYSFHEIYRMFLRYSEKKAVDEGEATEADVKEFVKKHCLGFSTAYKLMKVVVPVRRRRLQCIDNFQADNIEAFDYLNQYVNELAEVGRIDAATKSDLLRRSRVSSNFISYDQRVHMEKESRTINHCLCYLLSDSKNKNFATTCSIEKNGHIHDQVCQDCLECTDVFDVFLEILRKTHASIAKKDPARIRIRRMIEQMELSKDCVEEYRRHQIRAFSSEMDRKDILENLQPKEALIVLDFSLKLIPTSSVEKQSQWFAKAGIAYHMTYCVANLDGSLYHHSFGHSADDLKQDGIAASGITEHVLLQLKENGVEKVYIRSDNAGTYHNAGYLSTLFHIHKKTGVQVLAYIFSEAQAGKGDADREISHSKRKIRDGVDSKKNATNAHEVIAVLTTGTLLKASSFHEVELTEISVSKSSFPGVASYGSFRFEENGIRARMFDKIGGGIFIEEKKVIANEFECEVLSEGGYLSKSDGFWKKFDDEEDKDIAPEEELDENPIVAAKEGIFSCPDRLCISQFLTVNGLAKHKLRGVHRRRKNTESTIDAGVRMFAKAVETDTAAARSVKSDSLVPLKKSIKSKLPDKGWAMKKKEKATKISDEMAVEITEYFHKQRGEGKRALAREICASLKEMKNAKTGEYLFPLDKCPKESQCQTAISSLLREERCATSQKVNPTPKRRKLNDKEGSEESSDDNQPGGSKDDNDTNQMTTNKRTLKTKKSTSKKETIPIFEDEADDFADFMEEIDAADDPFFD